MVNTIANVDPDKYSYIELLQDVGDLSLSHVSAVIGFAINLHCDIPGSNDRMIVSSDLDVLKMFEIHNSREINLYVTTMSAVPCHTVHVSETVTVSSQSSEDEISFSDSDDVYGLTSEDEACVPSVGENLRKSTCNTAASPSVEVHGGDDFSNFESNDDVEYNPSSDDNSTDEGEGCSIIREKNEKARVTAHCADSSYMWRIHASPLPDGVTYMIKTYKGEHTCVRLQSNSNANSSWIAKKLGEAIRTNPNIKVDAMQTYLQQTYGIEASRMQLYRAKRRAFDEIEGKHGSSYTMLPMYASEIRRTNPGSLVKIECQKPSLLMNPLFKRIFIAFEALFKGFKAGCRPFIGIDGCHLKGPYGGVLLAAVSLDGNNGLFPIAVGVVESENRDSWGFFLQNLNTVIGAHSSEVSWTFMSDQQKGLDRVIVETFPEATHRRCCRHICANMRTAAISYMRGNIEEYCDVAFTNEKYIAAHQNILHPINDPKMWKKDSVLGDPIQPPPLKRLPSRPRKNRRREPDEDVGVIRQGRQAHSLKCKICQQWGHNRRTCQRAPVRGRGHGRGATIVTPPTSAKGSLHGSQATGS
ncbi:hypothetical protein F0562_025566 [Nyssa sinensis]|uniref:MULE transposase domain-containing protein n=1 Tax=Nyssa sinensis TaxID=561372 RepID=A0A5J5B8D7_9ASTE|nr:hypothetical protein F0562_025566 [Nyssa sinensis]